MYKVRWKPNTHGTFAVYIIMLIDMRSSFYIIVFLLFSSNALAQSREYARGIVYHDENRNGQKERSEKGLPEVAVSNGVDVVLTNELGEYVLPVGNDNIIFVVKPAGYAFPLDSNNQSRFYYIHKPLGSPNNLKYAGSMPTGKLPKSIDFPLYRQQEDSSFKALVFGDPQAYTVEEIDYFTKGVVQDVKNTTGMAFGISLGDLVGDDLVLHPLYQQAVSKLGLPWYNVMGNHDMNFDVDADSLSDETYERHFGPPNFAFNYANVHFIILDDILYPHPRTGKGYWGGLREDQLRFLENDLKFVPKDKLIVIAYHIPVFLSDRNEKHFRPEDRQRLMDLIAPFPHTVSMSAHTHYQEQVFWEKSDGFQRDRPHHEYNVGTTSGDWYSGELNHQGVPVSTMRDGTPRGYAILNIEGTKYSFEYRVAGQDSTYQIALTGAETLREPYARRHHLYANFFMGQRGSKVMYRVDKGEWREMEYISAPDPAYTFETLKYDHAAEAAREGKRPSDPVNSTHLWRIRYPRLSKGSHVFEVKGIDMYGKEHYAQKTVNVVE